MVDGGTGQYSELDINFRVMHPRGHPLVAEFKKSDGIFSQQIKVRISVRYHTRNELGFLPTIQFCEFRSKDADKVYAPLMMVSIGSRKRTLACQTVFKNGLIDTTFDPPLFSLDSTFKTCIPASYFSSLCLVCLKVSWDVVRVPYGMVRYRYEVP